MVASDSTPGAAEAPSLLVVEDEPSLREVLRLHLLTEGFVVRTVDDGEQALAACAERLPDVVVLDLMLPNLSGLEVCAALRRQHGRKPGVVMVTALAAEADIVMGLDSGADDYITKPFRPREVVARVRSVLRRVNPDADGVPAARLDALRAGSLAIDERRRSAELDGRALPLTATEFDLLLHLVRAPNTVFSRLTLLEAVWGTTHEGYARNVDCHITRLRRKLETASGGPAPIRTVHGRGYSYEIPES